MNKAAKPLVDKLKIAMTQTQKRVAVVDMIRASSFAQQVEALNIGESCSRVHGVHEGFTLKALAENMATMKEGLRNNTAPSVRQAKARTRGTYSIEIGDMRTPSGRTFVVAIVTRTA